MGGNGSGISRKRRTLPARYRPGWLRKLDQRSQLARGLHDHLAGIADDLGGMDALSTIQRDLAARYVHVVALVTEIENKAREGQPFDTGQYLGLVDRALRVGAALGLERRMKPAEDLHAYMRRKAAEVEQQQGGNGA